MEYLYEYLMFLAQAVTVVVAILLILSAVTSLGLKRQHTEHGHLEVRKLNDSLQQLKDGVRHAMLDPASFKKQHKADAKAAKREAKASRKHSDQAKNRTFVVDFKGDLQASRVDHLRTEITAILTMAEKDDEVVVRLESPGGAVHGYGLAASQLDRIRQHDVPLVVAVDKVAASGGYLMAAVANKILAAPFAVLGSIGVVAQIPNVHRLLKKHDVDVEILTAGKYKRTLTVLGENTEEGREKFLEELEEVHSLFQEFVGSRRPQLDMDEVATGEAWYGQRAIDRALVDEISTSDEYLTQACDERDVFEVQWVEHKKPIERLLAYAEGTLGRTLEKIGFGQR
jgi:serine protease SohB